MSLAFLSENGAHRMRNYEPQPILLDDEGDSDNTVTQPVDTEYECRSDKWMPKTVSTTTLRSFRSLRPIRFIDGKDSGHIVAWLQSSEGQPIPVRLSQIGAVVMREVGGYLRREFSIVERVVSMYVDPFPWEQAE